MANRHSPYRAKYLTREPKKLVGKFTVVNAANGAVNVHSNTAFNKGIYSITHADTGIYRIFFGSASTQVDPYTALGPVSVTFSAINTAFYVSNDQSSSATNPFVELTVYNGVAGEAVNLANTGVCRFELTFLDSTD
jgi:hypothetical protein